MRSSFFGLNVATQGLYSSRTSLDVTNHNITNAETEGYSRQVAEQKATRPLPAYSEKGMIGTGSEVVSIDQMRNQYFDVKYWNTIQHFGEYQVKDEQMKQLETIFKEPTDAGFSVEFNRMFEQLQRLSTNAGDEAYRSTFKDSAISFVSFFNSMDEQLRNMQRDLNFSVKSKVEEINFIANQLGSINGQIANLELDGSKANDLRDERAVLIDQLSKVVNVKTNEVDQGNNTKRFAVTINGQVLVDGNKANYLELSPRDTLYNPEDEPDLYDIYWESGQQFYLDDNKLGGELKGLLDMRDGNNEENFKGQVASTGNPLIVEDINRLDIPTSGEIMVDNVLVEYTNYIYDDVNNRIEFEVDPATVPAGASNVEIGNSMDYKGVPYYINRINEFVRTFAKNVNGIHKQGEDLNGNTDQVLFSYEGYNGSPPLDENDALSYNQITANNFTLDSRIIDDISNIATTYDISAGLDSNDLVLDLLNLKNDLDMFDKGKPESYMQALISELGIDAKQATNFKEGQENMLLTIENQRLSFSGVDLNEETANMLKFQHAYNLAAKMIGVMDEIYDVTINGMGV
ncbi:MAG: flagellar hook-associated protein FlgK [Eubacteriales bacterium]